MKHSLSSTQYCHSLGDLLRTYAIMSAVPKGFVMKSNAGRSLEIDPRVSVDKLPGLVEKGWKPIVTAESSITYIGKNSIVQAGFQIGRVDFQVYSADLDAAARAEKLIQPFEKFKFQDKEEGGVWVNFSYAGTMGGVERNTQFLRCPTWAEIRGNYAPSYVGELDRLMKMKKPWNHGRLMIWHGEPGTGKTFALRALLMAWRDRFNFVVVTDPEKMMANPSYYYEIASAPNMNSVPGANSDDDDDDDDSTTSKKKRLLFIIEDSADLLSVESRKRHWDKFGKLLNITDGLIGQGREDIFVPTFNEKIQEIDPAVIRPGRCISRVEFQKFTTEEAQDWLAKNKMGDLEPSGADTQESVSLAELYQMKAKAKKPVPVTV